MSKARASSTPASAYAGKCVLVTGGLGFVGSTLAMKLVDAGAKVRILDSLLPQGGGSPRNGVGLRDRAQVVLEDTRSRDVLNRIVEGCDVVFHLAGQAGPSAFAGDWYGEIDIACLGTLNVLEATRVRAPKARVVFGSSHYVYGSGPASPVTESSPTNPTTLFGVHKLAGEKYCGVYQSSYGLSTVVARMAWIYGPRQRLQGASSGTLAHFLDCALHDESFSLYGRDGEKRDLLYVEDAADALLALGVAANAGGQIVNVASGMSVTLGEMARLVLDAVGRGQLRPGNGGDHPPVADESFVADVSRLRALAGIQSTTSLADGIRKTADWYRGRGDAA